MMKTKKSTKSLALVLAAVLALTPMAGFPLTALATGDTAAPQTDAPVTAQTPVADAETPQAEAPATDAAQPAAPAAPATDVPAAPTAAAPVAAGEGDVAISEANFPDENFRKCIEEKGYDTNADGTLQAAELEKVTEFGMELDNPSDAEQAIKDLTGIKLFTSLQSFNAGRFWALEVLDLSGSKTLKTFSSGQLKHINLANCVNLDDFQLAGYETEYIDLSGCTSLKEFWSNDGAEKLTHLDLSNCSSLTKLYLLDLRSSASEGALYFDISGCTKLDSLDCSTQTAALPIGLAECKNLTFLKYVGSPTEKLDLSPFPLLTELDITGTGIETIDLAPVKNLTKFTSMGGKLKTLDFSPCPQLEQVTCYNNQLTSLDVSTNKALTTLYCYGNQLTSLDLTGKTFDSWSTISPQAPQVPVVKRGEAAYELDLEALAQGKAITAITLNGTPVDPEDYQSMHGAPPKSLQYTCATGALSTNAQTMEVAAAGFDLYYLATLSTDANGRISCDVAPSASGEILLAENSEPTFTATAASGYQIATLKVGKDDITVNEGATSQTLTLPAVTDIVAITATFEKIPAPIEPPVDPTDPVDPPNPPVDPIDPVDPVDPPKPPVDPTDPVDPPKPPVDPADPVEPIDPPKPPVNPTDPVDPPLLPTIPDNGGNNNGSGTTIVERTNTVVVPAAPQAAALTAPETPATPATAAAKTEAAPAKAAADTATPQGQLENPILGAQVLDTQHSHIPLALLLLAVWLVGGFAVIRQRKHTRDAIEGTSF